MKALFRTGTMLLAAAVSTGPVVVAGATAAAAGGDDRVLYAKREDSANSWVVSADDGDDDDDTNTGNTNTNTNTNTGANSNDATGSRVTAVSRDRDHSVDDVTKDWTRDGGGGRHRDFSANMTNDSSRHDTRGR
jgi:hypothetical protein